MDSPRSRLILGIAAVAIVAALCIGALWSVRGRLPAQPAPVAVAPPTDAALRAENLRLRTEVARLTAERNALLAKAQPVSEPPAVSAAPVPVSAPAHPRRVARPATVPQSGTFTEPQTFDSVSTAN